MARGELGGGAAAFRTRPIAWTAGASPAWIWLPEDDSNVRVRGGGRFAQSPAVLEDSTPSRWSRRFVVIALAATGALIALYLAAYQTKTIASVWDPVFGTSGLVLDSAVSRAIRRAISLPDAALGAIAYACEIVFAIIGSSRRSREHPLFVLVFGANSAALALTALGLVMLQAFVVHAWCFLCLISAAISLTIAWLVAEEVSAAIEEWRRR